ncbi:hypothetical protein GDO81_012857 [Engystomops pustulosus]|uniref:Uncharacterized protein n=1 Tax=Engystomops pustulosus TaxID=76066 RepID=A0AAV7AV81_ENGPU|nr:hypothetical protein GDO81_012857 [Engystomops pustulosus]
MHITCTHDGCRGSSDLLERILTYAIETPKETVCRDLWETERFIFHNILVFPPGNSRRLTSSGWDLQDVVLTGNSRRPGATGDDYSRLLCLSVTCFILSLQVSPEK